MSFGFETDKLFSKIYSRKSLHCYQVSGDDKTIILHQVLIAIRPSGLSKLWSEFPVCSQCKPFPTSRRRGRFLVNSLFRPSFIGSIGVPISLLSDNLVSAIHVSRFYLHESLRSGSANGTQSPITPSVLHSFVAAGEIFMQPSLMNPHLISTRKEPFALNLWKNPNTCI